VRSCTRSQIKLASEEAAMWTVHAAFRFGEFRTAEVDLTPVLGVGMIVVVFFLMLQTA